MLQLVNTIDLPYTLIAHGRDHLAAYKDGVLDTYRKNLDNTLEKVGSVNIADVTDLRISRDGRFVVARSAAQTFFVKGSTVVPYTLTGQSFDVFSSGLMISIDSVSGKVTTGNATGTQEFAAPIAAGDSVVSGYVKYAIWNANGIQTAYKNGAALAPYYTPHVGTTIIDVYHLGQDRFVSFLSDGRIVYQGASQTLPAGIVSRKNIGRYFLLADATKEYIVPFARPLTAPCFLRNTAP